MILTEMSPMPTNGVSAEVKTELDWTQKVRTAPIMILKYP